jgi:hypothetical protein
MFMTTNFEVPPFFYKIYKMTGRCCLSVALPLLFKLNLEISEQSLFLSSSLKECFKISPPHSGQNWIAFGPYLDHSKIVSHYLDRSEFPAQTPCLFSCSSRYLHKAHELSPCCILKRSDSVVQMCTVISCLRIFFIYVCCPSWAIS